MDFCSKPVVRDSRMCGRVRYGLYISDSRVRRFDFLAEWTKGFLSCFGFKDVSQRTMLFQMIVFLYHVCFHL